MRDYPKPIKDLLSALLQTGHHSDCSPRWSQRGVPHIVYRPKIGGMAYSICWFGERERKFYRIFEPYPSDTQKRTDCETIADVLAYLKEVQYE